MVKHLATMDACASNTRRFHTELLERSHHRTVQGAVNALSTKPDPQHAKLIIHQLGLSSLSRSVFTPNEKSKNRKLSTAQRSATRTTQHCLCAFVRWTRPRLAVCIIRIHSAASTNSWRRGCAREIRQVLGWTRTFYTIVLCDKLKVLHRKNCFMVPTCHAQPVPREWCFSLSSGKSEFHAPVKGTRDAGAVSTIKDLVVDRQ